jgi:protein-L-isoaspartate(D-aspartate) O-methyltransferase
VSDSLHLCSFVYLRGDYEGELSGSITVDELVTLHWDRDQAIDVAALTGVLDQPRDTAWSGITLGRNESPCR